MTGSTRETIRGFPATVAVGGAEISIRPLTAQDRDPLLEFFRRVPREDRRYLKEDVTSTEVIDRWLRQLDYTRVLPLVAWDRRRIVGDGTLHRRQAKRVGEVRIVIDPEYRNRGVGRSLLKSLIQVATTGDDPLDKLQFHIVADTEPAAAHTALALGFAKTGTFSRHIRYYQGDPHELDVYELQMGDQIELDDPAKYMF